MTRRSSDSRAVTAFEWIDERVYFSKARTLLNHIFPDHWSFMLGELAMYSFALLVVTGFFLALYFSPSYGHAFYHGPYRPLAGHPMIQSYDSTLKLSFQVRAGLLMRQTHHWAALIFIGSIVVHMSRVFFTGAFRRPREVNYMIGATMLALAIFNGYLGYSLPGDLESGLGLRIGYSILQSIPLVGNYLAVWLWGGTFPGHVLARRFFIVHVFVLPGLIAALLAAHLLFIWKQEHTQFKSKNASEEKISGSPLWPVYMAKSQGFMFVAWGVMFGLGAFVQIDPIWQYGPALPARATYATQPDFYLGWLEGALRVWPNWEINLPGHLVPDAFFPAVLLPFLTWVLIYSWPYLEAHFTGDHKPHHILDHPRDRPVRTGIGAMLFAFYFMLLLDGGDDVIANFFSADLNNMLWGLQLATLVVPPIVGVIAWRICKELQLQPARSKKPRHVIVERAEAGYYAVAEGLPLPSEPEGEARDVEEAGDKQAEILEEQEHVLSRRASATSEDETAVG